MYKSPVFRAFLLIQDLEFAQLFATLRKGFVKISCKYGFNISVSGHPLSSS